MKAGGSLDVLIIMALILVPVTALLSFLGYKFISYYEIVNEPPSVIKWIIGTVAVYIALIMVQLLRLLLGDYWNGFIRLALILAPIFIFGNYMAHISRTRYWGRAPKSLKTNIILTVAGYIIMLIAIIYHLLNSGSPT